jgi:hypothetical protein
MLITATYADNLTSKYQQQNIPVIQWEYLHEQHDIVVAAAVVNDVRIVRRRNFDHCCSKDSVPSKRDVWDVHKSIVSVSPVAITNKTQRVIIIQIERY